MTIDELLKAASEYTAKAISEDTKGARYDRVYMYAAIAQAAALTAQAMIMQEQRLEWLAENAEHDETDRRDYYRSQ